MKYKLYYDGKWCDPISNNWLEVFDPSNGESVGMVPNGDDLDMKEIIKSAKSGFDIWKNTNTYERSDKLEQLYDLVLEHKEVLAEVLTKENGKPYSESLGEIQYGANYIKWYSEEAKRIYGQLIPSSSDDKRLMVKRQGIGVAYGITPWNFPFAMLARKIAPALAAGCSFIIKPASETPITAVKFFELIHQVGFPKGVVNLIIGDPKPITQVAMDSNDVRKITFTGSTEVGKLLMAQAAQTVKNISLELGGHAPLIIFEDADIEKAVMGTLASKFRNCGQVCIATNRVLIHHSIKDQYLKRLVEVVSQMKIGNGFDKEVSLGPIIHEKGFDKIVDHINDAQDKGAILKFGGKRLKTTSEVYFIEPTILDQVTTDMKIWSDETFGPVIPVLTFDTNEEAIRLANDTPYGLAAYYFTESISRSILIAEALDYGIIGLNTGSPSSAQAPFGGFKESGIGREGGQNGIEEYLETKYICTGL